MRLRRQIAAATFVLLTPLAIGACSSSSSSSAKTTTTKATTASYTGIADRVPSKFDRVQLAIPEGLHELSVELLSPPRGSAEIHARIPQPTVGGEE